MQRKMQLPQSQSYYRSSIFASEFRHLATSDLRIFSEWSADNQHWEDKEFSGKITHSPPFELNPPIQDQTSMHVVIRPFVVLGQFFGLVPVCGIFGNDPSNLRFSWRSKKVVYSLILLVASVMLAVVQISSSLVLRGLTYKNIVDMISLVLSVGEMMMCIRQAQTWPKLIGEWTSAEQRMRHFQPLNMFSTKVKLLVYSYFLGSIILVVAQFANYMHMLRRCSQDTWVLMKLAIVAMYYPLFSLLGFSVFTTTLLMCLTMHHYILVIFDELTITVLSYCLSVKFCQLSTYLIKHKNQRMSRTFWVEMRETYNSLSSLTKLLDSHLSPMTVLCFGSNLYYNCTLLLDLLSGNKKNTWASIFVLLFTMTRTFLAALSASHVAEESKKPLASLFSVPSESYNVEVAGTILTYEIVLLQFGTINLDTGSTNKTALCYKVMAIIG